MATLKKGLQGCVWEDVIKEKKLEIVAAMGQHQEISRKTAEVLLLRQRVSLLQTALQEQKRSYETIIQELELLKKSNDRKEEKSKKAKSRDFHKKFTYAQSECHNKQVTLHQEKEQLVKLRQSFIYDLMKRVFPISLSQSTNDSQDCFHFIGCGSLPSDGNMKDYIKAVKLKSRPSQSPPGTRIEESTKDGKDSLTDPVLSVPAAISLISHSVWIIADVLDQILPHSLILPVVLCEYGRSDRKPQTIVQFLTRLDDNITFLAFTQNISPQSLSIGHTLSNLTVLINHHELGRTGSFTCHPELLHCPVVRKRSYEHDDCTTADDNEPPLLHTATDTTCSSTEKYSPDLLSPQETDHDEESSDNDSSIIEGWEEVHDLMVPTTRLYHRGNRLEYGTSFSEYSQQTVLNESHDQEISSSAQYSSGLLDTISSLLGSGWTRK